MRAQSFFISWVKGCANWKIAHYQHTTPKFTCTEIYYSLCLHASLMNNDFCLSFILVSVYRHVGMMTHQCYHQEHIGPEEEGGWEACVYDKYCGLEISS